MGQKVHPLSFRLGINKEWKSQWYVNPRDYVKTLHEDIKMRKLLKESLLSANADVSDIEIVRQPQRILLTISTARPGVIIGTKGANIEKISNSLQKLINKHVQVKIKEIEQPAVNAKIIGINIARQLRNRVTFRRTLKMALANAMKAGAQGIKIQISGRLGGSDMSRRITMKEGRIPLHTLRANIDYGFAESHTAFGTVGVKVWVYSGEIYRKARNEDAGVLVRKPKQFSPKHIDTRGAGNTNAKS